MMEAFIKIRIENTKIIHKYINEFLHHVGKNAHHASFKGGWCIAQSKWHPSVGKYAKGHVKVVLSWSSGAIAI